MDSANQKYLEDTLYKNPINKNLEKEPKTCPIHGPADFTPIRYQMSNQVILHYLKTPNQVTSAVKILLTVLPNLATRAIMVNSDQPGHRRANMARLLNGSIEKS